MNFREEGIRKKIDYGLFYREKRKRVYIFQMFHTLFSIQREMILLEEQYYDINQRLLTIAGLWPYQKWRFRIIPIIFFLSILISFLLVQVRLRSFNFMFQ